MAAEMPALSPPRRRRFYSWALLTYILLSMTVRLPLSLRAARFTDDDAECLFRATGRGAVYEQEAARVLPPFGVVSSAGEWHKWLIPGPDTTARAIIKDLAGGQTAHPPIYYLCLWRWEMALGGGPRSASVLNWLLSGVCLLLFVALCRRFLGPRGTLAATVLLSSSVPFVLTAVDTRSYVLLNVVTLAFLIVAVEMSRQRGDAGRLRRWLCAYVVVGAVGIYTEYIFAFVLLATNLWWLGTAVRRHPVAPVRGWLLAQFAIVALALPLTPLVRAQRSAYAYPPLPAREVVSELVHLVEQDLFVVPVLHPGGRSGIVLLAGLVGLIGLAMAGAVRNFSGGRELMLWVAACASLPIVALVARGVLPPHLIGAAQGYRYFLPAVPAFIVMLAAAGRLVRCEAARILLAIAVCVPPAVGMTRLAVSDTEHLRLEHYAFANSFHYTFGPSFAPQLLQAETIGREGWLFICDATKAWDLLPRLQPLPDSAPVLVADLPTLSGILREKGLDTGVHRVVYISDLSSCPGLVPLREPFIDELARRYGTPVSGDGSAPVGTSVVTVFPGRPSATGPSPTSTMGR